MIFIYSEIHYLVSILGCFATEYTACIQYVAKHHCDGSHKSVCQSLSAVELKEAAGVTLCNLFIE